MTERRIRHQLYTSPLVSEISDENKWFLECRGGLPNLLFVHDDIRFARYLAAQMLTEAWDEEKFFQENGHLRPEPTEIDRMLMITYLQQLVSASGLINSEEIEKIRAQEGQVDLSEFVPKDPELEGYEELVARTRIWKDQGLTIGLFHGSFDPPTVMHLACATDAYKRCDRLIIGFDSDDLIRKRKGQDRPRFPVDKRRKIFGSFWPIDGTFVLRASDVGDTDDYANDYRELGVNYVFLASNQEDMEERLKKIQLGGAEPRYLGSVSEKFSATEILRLIQRRREESQLV